MWTTAKTTLFFSVVWLNVREKKTKFKAAPTAKKFEIKHLFAAPEKKKQKQKEEFSKEIDISFFRRKSDSKLIIHQHATEYIGRCHQVSKTSGYTKIHKVI